jgi:hypothetical protein
MLLDMLSTGRAAVHRVCFRYDPTALVGSLTLAALRGAHAGSHPRAATHRDWPHEAAAAKVPRQDADPSTHTVTGRRTATSSELSGCAAAGPQTQLCQAPSSRDAVSSEKRIEARHRRKEPRHQRNARKHRRTHGATNKRRRHEASGLRREETYPTRARTDAKTHATHKGHTRTHTRTRQTWKSETFGSISRKKTRKNMWETRAVRSKRQTHETYPRTQAHTHTHAQRVANHLPTASCHTARGIVQ